MSSGLSWSRSVDPLVQAVQSENVQGVLQALHQLEKADALRLLDDEGKFSRLSHAPFIAEQPSNTDSKWKLAPLHCAVSIASETRNLILQLLLLSGASPNAQAEGRARQLAMSLGITGAVELLDEWERDSNAWQGAFSRGPSVALAC